MQIEIAVDARNGVGEGPMWDTRDGRLWWVDIPERKIFAWRPGGDAPQVWPVPNFPCSIVPRAKGGHLVALRDGVYAFDAESGGVELFCAHEPDRPDNRANEGKCDAQGRFWLGTMQCNLNDDGTPREMTADTGALYCIQPDGSFSREVDDVGLSNTLAWTDDGRTLLFADTKTNVISAFECDGATGALSNRRVFSDVPAPGVCDGSAIDADGFLWNARFSGGCLARFTPDGRIDRIVELPVSNPTSCCFGGPDLRTLYVTSASFHLSKEHLATHPHEGAILAIDAGVAGTPTMSFAG